MPRVKNNFMLSVVGVFVVILLSACDPMAFFNDPPVADAGEDITVFLGTVVELDGSRSSDPDGDTLNFEWQLEAYPPGSALRNDDIVGRSNRRAYVEPDVVGKFDFVLNVSDQYETRSAFVTITVQDEPVYPVAVISAPDDSLNTKIGTNVNFVGSTSSVASGSIANYDWNFGDGTTKSGAEVSHTYTADGVYAVSLTVTSDAGYEDTATIVVIVAPDDDENGDSEPIVITDVVLKAGANISVLEQSFKHDNNTETLRFGWDAIDRAMYRWAPAIEFDTRSLAGKKIVSAVLTFTAYGTEGKPGTMTGKITPIATSWSEDRGLSDTSSSWVNTRYPDRPEFTISRASHVNVDITKIVQEWANGDLTNRGVALYVDPVNATGQYLIGGRESRYIPHLTVKYHD